MPRNVLIGVLLAALAVIAFWQFRGDDARSGESDSEESRTATQGNPGGDDAPSTAEGHRPRVGNPGASSASPVFGSVTGQVLDVSSGDPVPYVDVIFRHGGQESSATSDESGRYEVSLSAGRYEVRAIGEGVVAKATPLLRVGQIDNLNYDIRVARLATLRGRVVDPDRRGIGDVEIALRTETAAAKAYPHRGEIGLTESGSDGSFELLVPPGIADLQASHGESNAYTTVSNIASGAVVENIEILLDRRGSISGVVRKPDGGGASGATVFISVNRPGTGQYDRETLETDKAGRFAAEKLRPGRYVVEAMMDGFGSSAPEMFNLTPTNLKQEMTVSLHPPLSLSGMVIDENDEPVGNVNVAQVWVGSKQRYAKQQTAADGRFEFTGLGPGPHMVRASKEGFASVQLLKLIAPMSDIKLRLLATGGLHGTVTNAKGEPVSRFTVEYRAKDKTNGPSAEFLAVDGRFDIFPVDPGHYQVVVSASGLATGIVEDVEVPSTGYGDGSVSLQAK